jgi:hypothetical protein
MTVYSRMTYYKLSTIYALVLCHTLSRNFGMWGDDWDRGQSPMYYHNFTLFPTNLHVIY